MCWNEEDGRGNWVTRWWYQRGVDHEVVQPCVFAGERQNVGLNSQILMVCLIFNGFKSGATARVITRFALLDLNLVMFTAHVHCSNVR